MSSAYRTFALEMHVHLSGNFFAGAPLSAMTPPNPDVSPRLPEPVEGMSPITIARLKLDMSLNDLARAARIDPAHLELLERRSHFASPTLDELQRIAAILHVGVDDIR